MGTTLAGSTATDTLPCRHCRLTRARHCAATYGLDKRRQMHTMTCDRPVLTLWGRLMAALGRL